MDPHKNQLVLTVFFSTLILFNSTQAICAPRSPSHSQPSNSPPSELHSVSSIPPSPPPEQQLHPPLSPPKRADAPEAPHASSFPPPPPPEQQLPPPLSPPKLAPAPTLDDHHASTISGSQSETEGHSLFHALFHPHSFLNSAIDPAIKKICNETDHPHLCLSSIAPFLSGKTDPVSVLEMVIKACAQQAKLAITAAIRKVSEHNVSPIMASCLRDCEENYRDALDNLQSAMDAISTRDIGTINSMLSAAISDFSTCEDGFAEISFGRSPMAAIDENLTKMVSNSLAVASLIN